MGLKDHLVPKDLFTTLSQCLEFLPWGTLLPNSKRSFAGAKVSFTSSSILFRGEKTDKNDPFTFQLLVYHQILVLGQQGPWATFNTLKFSHILDGIQE